MNKQIWELEMNIITKSADCLNKGLFKLAIETTPTKLRFCDVFVIDADVFEAKAHIFNTCTAGLIASIAFGLLGSLSPASAIFLGGFFFYGRKVSDESFNVMLPRIVKYVAPNTLKPKSLLSFDKIVIFYNTSKRSFFG